MKLIAGLGNPGKKYRLTRHTIGFRIVEKLVADAGKRFRSAWLMSMDYSRIAVTDEPVMVVKPMTYMNRSGTVIGRLKDKYRVSLDDVLIIYDDVALPFGKIRLRAQGSAGGHNGLQSVIDALESKAFSRLRFGVGAADSGASMIDYVLSPFTEEEEQLMDEQIAVSVDAVESWLRDGAEKTMNLYNN